MAGRVGGPRWAAALQRAGGVVYDPASPGFQAISKGVADSVYVHVYRVGAATDLWSPFTLVFANTP